ncbi:acyl-CoA dehydrogenase family protein [Tepidimonas charontis]|uniref:Putative acyl-CoA dehydrogenase AidB n=1 Tax=Tepidimonas charontis TaxID=2267262 RepID=A0A554X2I2_9BURK|nr:acyl-CoA dehydrogenase family protein [Tepidimonas charontis]TSE30061.1 putative acyl-CoA dehydrogenase AidB [Tepidimonas charontis]
MISTPIPAAWRTHEVRNQVLEAWHIDPWHTDTALQEAVRRGPAADSAATLAAIGAQLANPTQHEAAARANRNPPQHQPYDSRGHRVDRVVFDPAWHERLAQLRADGVVTRPFEDAHPGRWTEWAAAFYLHGQVEQGSLCPATMTLAAIPLLRREPAFWAWGGAQLLTRAYDPSDCALPNKRCAWIGMGMTEKQGGSDVRANATVARSDSDGWRLRGHKWFYSAPTSDAHLVTAKVDSEDGPVGCFFVPRWRPDGQRNGVLIQRLKDKLGNRSNASGEVEFLDAWALPVGDVQRGIPTILEMATTTRLCCVLGSAAILRQALVQALHYARRRLAFGRALAEQPLMQTVLVDLALESEAALWLALRLAQAFEAADDALLERAWQRILTPAAKFWVCKRAIACTAEAMEVLGGNGYVEDSLLPRLLREAPVNSIWEGSGNIMCLDVLRAIGRHPEQARALLAHVRETLSSDEPARAACERLTQALHAEPTAWEGRARWITQQWVLLTQAALLRQHAPTVLADAFIASRFTDGGYVAGTHTHAPQAARLIMQRALPLA